MILGDSSVWIDFFNGKSTPQTLYLRDEVERHEILLGERHARLLFKNGLKLKRLIAD